MSYNAVSIRYEKIWDDYLSELTTKPTLRGITGSVLVIIFEYCYLIFGKEPTANPFLAPSGEILRAVQSLLIWGRSSLDHETELFIVRIK